MQEDIQEPPNFASGLFSADISAEEAITDINKFLTSLADDSQYDFLRHLNDTISMLHEDVLLLLYYLAGKTHGGILELGTYIGGGTIAIAKGLRQPRPFVSVEIGGAHDHPTMASEDIFADLQQNLTKYEVADLVQPINGNSRDPDIVAAVKEALGDEKIGLFVLDTDGFVDRDIEIYAPLLADGCVLVADDYISGDTAQELDRTYPGYKSAKSNAVKPAIDRLVKDCRLLRFGVYGWGTWVGRMC